MFMLAILCDENETFQTHFPQHKPVNDFSWFTSSERNCAVSARFPSWPDRYIGLRQQIPAEQFPDEA